MSQNSYELFNSSFSVFSHRGALEMVHLEVAAWFAQDNLKVTQLQIDIFWEFYPGNGNLEYDIMISLLFVG